MTREKFLDLFVYCPETGSLTWKVSRGKAKAGNEVGWISVNGYRETSVDYACYKTHRIIFMMMTGKWPELEIDHINGNKLDNRWLNLRDCSHRKNMQNRTKRNSQNTSGFIGVVWNRRNKRWQVFIGVNDRQLHVGYYRTKIEAVDARIQAEREHWI